MALNLDTGYGRVSVEGYFQSEDNTIHDIVEFAKDWFNEPTGKITEDTQLQHFIRYLEAIPAQP